MLPTLAQGAAHVANVGVLAAGCLDLEPKLGQTALAFVDFSVQSGQFVRSGRRLCQTLVDPGDLGLEAGGFVLERLVPFLGLPLHLGVVGGASSAALPPGKMTPFELQKATTENDNWYESRRLPATARRLVAVVLQDGKFPLFSPVLRWSADNPASHTILTTVEPGVRFEGTIDPAVPRPVKKGRVMVHATTPPKDPSEEWSCSVWSDTVPIAEDGTFVLESMPRGCDLQVVAICEGWSHHRPNRSRNDAAG